MAAVAVLQPKDSVATNCMKFRRIPKHNPNPRSDRRKRSPSSRNSTTNGGTTTTPATIVPAAKNLVMGQVKILKRGEDIVEAVKATPLVKVDQKSKVDDVSKLKVVNLKDDLVLSTTDRLGPEPEMVPKLPEMYAGSAFFDSPPPSSLPIPAFFAKEKAFLKDPTLDLLRLLRLNL